jgi:hypothetical protein
MAKLGNQLPQVEILHPYPEVRFALRHCVGRWSV